VVVEVDVVEPVAEVGNLGASRTARMDRRHGTRSEGGDAMSPALAFDYQGDRLSLATVAKVPKRAPPPMAERGGRHQLLHAAERLSGALPVDLDHYVAAAKRSPGLRVHVGDHQAILDPVPEEVGLVVLALIHVARMDVTILDEERGGA